MTELIEKMIREVQLYKHVKTDKDQLMRQYIQARLNESFNAYEKELKLGIEYLQRRNELNVLRKLNKL